MKGKSTRHPGPLRKLPRDLIDHIFETSDTQASYLLALHGAVIDDLAQAEKVEGYVQCSKELWLYLCDKCVAWDKLHCPNAMPGGAWLNQGFSNHPSLRGEQIAVPPVKYQPNHQRVLTAQS